MAELIDRGALYKAFYERDCDAMELDGILDVVANFPTIDAAPVAHARWTSKTNWTLDKCSNCGKNGFPEWPYCPGCGAKMRMDADAPERGEGSGH